MSISWSRVMVRTAAPPLTAEVSGNGADSEIEMRDAVNFGNRGLHQGDIRQVIHGQMPLDVCDVLGSGFKSVNLAG